MVILCYQQNKFTSFAKTVNLNRSTHEYHSDVCDRDATKGFFCSRAHGFSSIRRCIHYAYSSEIFERKQPNDK